MLIDSLGFVLVVWSIPAAILLVGTPIVLVVALVIAVMRWILQPYVLAGVQTETAARTGTPYPSAMSIAFQLESPLYHPPPPVFLWQTRPRQPLASSP